MNVTFKFHESFYEKYKDFEPEVKPQEPDLIDKIAHCPTDSEIVNGFQECDDFCKIL